MYTYLIQIGEGRSAYKTRYTFESKMAPVGNLLPVQVAIHYNSINIDTSRGYKKRLVCVDNSDGTKTTVARVL